MAASGPIQKDEQMTVLNKATFECLVMVVALFRIEQQQFEQVRCMALESTLYAKQVFSTTTTILVCVWRESPIGPI